MGLMEMLWQYTGVLLQTVPVALLIGSLFEEEEIRGKKHAYEAGSIGVLMLASAIFPIFWSQGKPGLSVFAFGNLMMTLVIIAFCVFFFIIVKAEVIKKLIALAMGFNYAAVVFLINSIYVKYMYGKPQWKYSYTPQNLFGIAAITTLTWPAVFWFSVRKIKPSLQKISPSLMRRQCFFALAGLLFFCMGSSALDFDDKVYVLAGVVGIVGNIVIMYYFFFNEIDLMKEQIALLQQVNNFKLQSRSIGKNMEEMKRMQHNIRHHLNVISALNEEGKKEDIAEYLRRYETAYTVAENEKLTGYLILDSVLRYYFQWMHDEGIQIQTNFQIGSNYEFDPVDITILFGNCLENVIEEQRSLPGKERLARLDIGICGEMMMISLKNRCIGGGAVNGGEFSDFKSFLSSKRGAGLGEGLKSVDIVAKKYGGSARFKKDGGWFIAYVILKVP